MRLGQATPLAALPASGRMNLSIVLSPANREQLQARLERLYDPSSPDYRHFLTVKEFREQFGPSPESYQKVVDFARANGLEVTGSPANDMVIPVSGTVDQIERAFKISLNLYQHPTESRTFFSTDREPSIPAGLGVAHIAGLNNYALPKPMLRQPLSAGQKIANVSGSGPGGNYLGSDMRAAYYGGTALTGKGQSVALAQFGGYDIDDVIGNFAGAATASANGPKGYTLNYTPQAGGSTYSVAINNVLLDGQTLAPQGEDAEEALDIAQAIGMAPGLSQVRVYIGLSDVDVLNAIASDDVANQVSISWSWMPDDPDVDDFLFEEMAAQGQSVFVASGDSGSYSIFAPYFFPAEDAYVTAVGGTTLETDGPGGEWVSEIAWTASGGGVSPDLIPMPRWQQGIATSANQASSTYRNVPDVAMEADFDNYSCNMGQCQGGWAGTSFASPRWAGYIALVNQAAAAQGQGPIGLPSPWIYAIGQSPDYDPSFHDITTGNDGYYAGVAEFYAVPGYDLVTGWGSPAGGSLVSVLAPASAVGFHLDFAPSSLKVQPGGSNSTTIMVSSHGGFSGPVTLSFEAVPPGIAPTFSQNPFIASTVLTLTAEANAPRGSFLLNITANGGGQTAKGYIAVEIEAPGMMVSSADPYTWITPGYASSVELDMSSFAGFSGTPSLSVTSPLTSGVTAVLNPNTLSGKSYSNPSITSGASYVTFIGDNDAQPSADSIQVTAQDGSVVDARTVYLDVTNAQYRLDMQPMVTHLARGASVEMTVSALPVGNFSDTAMNLSTLFALPSGVTVAFNPTVIHLGKTSTMTVTASPTAALGAFYISAVSNAANPQLSPYIAFQMTVEAAVQAWFQIEPAANYSVAPQSGSFTDHFSVLQENGFSQGVMLEPPSVPGMELSFGSSDAAGGEDVTFTSPSDLPAALWICTGYGYVAGSGSSAGDQEPAHVWILSAPTLPLKLSTQTAAVTLDAGGSASAPVSIAPENGYTGTAALAATGLPTGISASFDANPAQTNTTLRLTGDASLPSGAYFVNVSATANGQTLVRTIPIEVGPVTGGPKLPAPMFTPAPGTYTTAQAITITDSVPNAAIHYTADGSTPTTASSIYSGPITVGTNETLEAMAVASGYRKSSVAGATFTFPAAVPVISPAGGTFTSAQTVAISDSTPGAVIYYTTNGRTPTTGSNAYCGPIRAGATETIEAIAAGGGHSLSPVASARYIISPPSNPSPTVTALSPAFVRAGSSSLTLAVYGSGFTSDSIVSWGSTALETKFASATQLTAQIAAAEIATPGVYSITVETPSEPAPGSGSNTFQFEVDSAASGGSTDPSFSSTAATVVAGSTAIYAVTLPASATDVTVNCLNLPAGAACSYSAPAGTISIATTLATTAGTYQITVVFSETLSGAELASVFLPILLLPLVLIRKRLAAQRFVWSACLGAVLLGCAVLSTGCGGGSSTTATSIPRNPSYQATSSGLVSLTIQ
ncbi:MAG: chitobiase/beta-hexosaminidase C-terminal domain-containing protein [Terracidiphilus sp.]